MSLDVLFEQILRSEQNAEDRRAEIIQIKKEISDCEKEIRELHGSVHNVKQLLNGKEALLLYEEQAESEVLSKQIDSLLQQKKKLDMNVRQLKTSYENNSLKNESEFNSFMQEIDAFVETYSLTNPETNYFENQQLAELEKLRKKERIEKKELEHLKLEEEKRNAIIEHHACLGFEVSHLRATIIDLDSQLDEKRKIVQEKKAELEAMPNASCEPEYCRLQMELHSLDSKATEAEVLRLRNELVTLYQSTKN